MKINWPEVFFSSGSVKFYRVLWYSSVSVTTQKSEGILVFLNTLPIQAILSPTWGWIFLTHETDFALILAVLENSVLPMG